METQYVSLLCVLGWQNSDDTVRPGNEFTQETPMNRLPLMLLTAAICCQCSRADDPPMSSVPPETADAGLSSSDPTEPAEQTQATGPSTRPASPFEEVDPDLTGTWEGRRMADFELKKYQAGGTLYVYVDQMDGNFFEELYKVETDTSATPHRLKRQKIWSHSHFGSDRRIPLDQYHYEAGPIETWFYEIKDHDADRPDCQGKVLLLNDGEGSESRCQRTRPFPDPVEPRLPVDPELLGNWYIASQVSVGDRLIETYQEDYFLTTTRYEPGTQPVFSEYSVRYDLDITPHRMRREFYRSDGRVSQVTQECLYAVTNSPSPSTCPDGSRRRLLQVACNTSYPSTIEPTIAPMDNCAP